MTREYVRVRARMSICACIRCKTRHGNRPNAVHSEAQLKAFAPHANKRTKKMLGVKKCRPLSLLCLCLHMHTAALLTDRFTDYVVLGTTIGIQTNRVRGALPSWAY